MIRIAYSFTRVVLMALIGATAVATASPAATAGTEDTPFGVWMAAAATRASAGTNFGRLRLTDGVLTFSASALTWHLPVAQIKRASIEQSDRLVVESLTGEIFYVTILDARMVPDSPRGALKIIQKALQAPAVRR